MTSLFEEMTATVRKDTHPYIVDIGAMEVAALIKQDLKSKAARYFGVIPFDRVFWERTDLTRSPEGRLVEITNGQLVEFTGTDRNDPLLSFKLECFVRVKCEKISETCLVSRSHFTVDVANALIPESRVEHYPYPLNISSSLSYQSIGEAQLFALHTFLTALACRDMTEKTVKVPKATTTAPVLDIVTPSHAPIRVSLTRKGQKYLKYHVTFGEFAMARHWVQAHEHLMPRFRNGAWRTYPEIIGPYERGAEHLGESKIKQRRVVK